MASLGELTLFISAESKQAVSNIQQVSKLADQATAARRLAVRADTTQAKRELENIAAASNSVTRNAGLTNKALRDLGSSSLDIRKLATEFVYLDDRLDEANKTIGKLRKTLDTVGLGGINKAVDSSLLSLTARFKPELLEEQIKNSIVQGATEGAETTKRILYKNFFTGVSEGIRDGVNTLAKIGFAAQGLMFIVEPIKTAFKGLFDFTIGQNIQLRDTILATQTTLATAMDVMGADGQKITDPYEKIIALEKPVNDAIESIRMRSLKLAGVTSSQVVDVFSVVATNIGQINGDLKDAENLAIAFTAALGTLGIPLFQARQEIGSILGGYITEDSLLAKRLGITNKDVQKAKTDVGGVTKFLLDKLKTAEAGQAILATGFRGVISNIQELFELIGLAVGKPLLDPLVNGLNKLFQVLYTFKTLLVEIGETIATTFTSAFDLLFRPFLTGGFAKQVRSAFDSFTAPLREMLAQEEAGQGTRGFLEDALLGRNPERVPKVLNGLIKQMRDFRVEIRAAADEAGGPLARLLGSDRTQGFNPLRLPSLLLGDPTVFNKGWDTLRSTIEDLGKAVGSLAVAFAKFKIREFADTMRLAADIVMMFGNAFLAGANLAASFFQVLSNILSLPVVEFFNQVRIATKLIGISDLVDNLKILVLGFVGIKGAVQTSLAAIQAFQTGLRGIAVASQAMQMPLTAMTQALAGLSVTGRIFATAGDVVGRTIDKLGTALGYTAEQLKNFKADLTSIDGVSKMVKGSLRSLVGQMITWNVIFAGITLALGVAVTAVSNYFEAQRKAKAEAESLNKALRTSNLELLKLAESTNKLDASKFSAKVQGLKNELETLVDKIAKADDKLEELKKNEAGATKGLNAGNELPGWMRWLANANVEADKAALANIEAERKKTLGQRAKNEADAQILADKIAFAERIERQKEEGKLLAQQRKGLEEEVAKQRQELNRQVADKEFAMRMEVAREEARLVKETADFRINQARKAADALVEGQTGAGAEAIRALNEYISVRDGADAERQMQEKEFQLSIQEMDKELADFKLQVQEKIAEIQKRVGKFQMQVADYQVQRAIDAANAMAGNNSNDPNEPSGNAASDVAMRFFMGKGLSKLQASALVGGFMQESGLRSNAINPSSKAEGIAQWTSDGGRKEAMVASGARNNYQKQLEYVWYELNTAETEARDALKNAKTLNEALLAAAKYERFNGYQQMGGGTEWGDRIAYTKSLLGGQSMGGQRVGPGTLTATSGLNPETINRATQATSKLTGVNNQCAEAVKSFMRVLGVNASVMDSTAKSAEKMGVVMTDWSQLKPGDIVARGRRGAPEHVGVYTGENNVFHQSASRGLKSGNFADLGYFKQQGYFIRPGTQSQIGDAGTGTADKPQLDLAGIDMKMDTSSLDAANERLKVLKERFVELRKEIQAADTAEKLTAVSKKIYGAVDLMGLQETIAGLEAQQKLVDDITDPEKYAIAAELKAKEAKAEEARLIALGKAREEQKAGKLTTEELTRIEAQLGKDKEKFLLDLAKERQLREQILNLQRAAAMIPTMKEDMKSSALGFNQEMASRSAGLNAMGFYSPQARRMAQAEGAIESYRLGITQNDTLTMSDDQKAQFEDYSSQQRMQAQALGQMDAVEERMQRLAEVSSQVGGHIAQALTSGFKEVITGARTVTEVLSEMFDNIANSFFQMAAQIIQEMLKMLIYKSLLGLFGGNAGGGLGSMFGSLGGGGGGGGRVDGASLGLGSIGSLGSNGFSMPGPDQGYQWLPNITASANGNILRGGFQAFAKGGMVNKPTLGLVGEGAYNEAIVPLPNGKAIPVDMKGQSGNTVNTNITVNVDNQGGTQTEMTGDQAGKLGKAIDNAVKRVILEERRPGGMLSGR